MAYLAGISLAIIAMFSLGIYNYLVKGLGKRVNMFSLLVVMHSIILILLSVLTFIFSDFLITDWETFFIATLASFFGAIAFLCLFYAIDKGKLSIVVPVINSFPIFSLVFGLIFLNETVKFWHYLFIIIIIVGVILLSIRKVIIQDIIPKHKTPFFLALSAAFFLGLYYVTIKSPTTEFGVLKTLFYTEFIMVIFFFIADLFLRIKFEKPNTDTLKEITIMTMFYTIAIFSTLFALKYAPVSIVTPIMSASTLVAVMFGIYMLKERLLPYQKLGILLILIGVVSLSIF